MTAVQRRVSGWLEVFREFLCQADPSLPRARIADELAARFDSRVSWNWQDPDGQGGFELNAPIPGWPPSGVAESLPELLALHPLVRWYAASGPRRVRLNSSAGAGGSSSPARSGGQRCAPLAARRAADAHAELQLLQTRALAAREAHRIHLPFAPRGLHHS